MSATTPVFSIVPTTQQYDWGKRGLESKVAQLAQKAGTPGFEFDESKPYAEVSYNVSHIRIYKLTISTFHEAMDGHTHELTISSRRGRHAPRAPCFAPFPHR